MKRKSLLIMLLVALFVPLAMNAQNGMPKKSMSSPVKKEIAQVIPSTDKGDRAVQKEIARVAPSDDRGDRASSTVNASKIASSSATWTGSAGETWSVAITGGATNQNMIGNYAQFGTKSSPSTRGTFSTSGIPGTITSVAVDCASYNGLGNVSVTVGGAVFGGSQSIPSWSNNVGGTRTFTGSASGAIVVTMTNASNGRAMYIKSITVTYSACGAPENLTVSNTTPTSATVTWEGSASSYNLQYRELAEETVYFSDDFESGSLDTKGWTTIRNGQGTENTDWHIVNSETAFSNASYSAHSGTEVVMSRSYSGSAYGVDNWLITPQVTLDGTLKFWVMDDGTYHETFNVYVSTRGNSIDDFTLLSSPGNATNAWGEVTVDLSSYNGAQGYIAIRNQDYDKDWLFMDDFSISKTTGTIGSWSSVIPVNGNSYTIEGLSEGVGYEVQVQGVCDGQGQSNWVNTTFSTPSYCDMVPTDLDVELTDNSAELSWTGYQDSYTVQYRIPAFDGYYINEPLTPDNIGDWGAYNVVDNSGFYYTDDTQTDVCWEFYYGTSAQYLFSPDFPRPTQQAETLTFEYKVYNSSYPETFEVLYFVGDDIVSEDPVTVSNTDWAQYTSQVPVGATGFVIAYLSNNQYLLYLDNFVISSDEPVTEGTDWVSVTSDGNTFSLAFSELESESLYEWQVQGVDCDGNGGTTDWSASSFFTTPEIPEILVESITASDITMFVGDEVTINPTVLPAEASQVVTYESADTDIATVTAAGVVIGVAAGTAHITIAATDGSGISTTIEVTVSNIAVTEITATSTEITMITGETEQISYTVAPENATDPSVTITSADPTIATVDENGVVTGVSVGETTITIASVSNPEVTAEITVTVTSNPNAVQFTVNIPATAQPGDVITVEAYMAAPTSGNYDGFTSLGVHLYYDNTAFQHTADPTYGAVGDACMIKQFSYPSDGVVRVAFVQPAGSPTTVTGLLFSMEFTVLAEAELGSSYTFQVEPMNAANFTCNYNNGQPATQIPYEFTPSTVTIAEQYTLPIIGYDTEAANGTLSWYLIASPIGTIANDNLEEKVTNIFSNSYDLYYFNQSGKQGDDYVEWINYKPENGTYQATDNYFDLVRGKGYLYANSQTVDLVFTGVAPSTEDFDVTLAYDGDARFAGWNLVGNPYAVPAYFKDIDLEARPFYTMNSAGTSFVPCTEEEGSIEPMQGVFVIAESNNETLTFTTTQPTSKGRGIVLNLGEGRENIDRAIVRFGEGRTLPKLQLFEGSTKIYIPQEGKEYAVVRSEEIGEMPVNFKAESNGTYSLNVSGQNTEFAYLHLIDNMTGNDVDLLDTPSYSFKAKTTDYESRFKLVYATGNASDDTFAFFSNGSFVINNEGSAELQVVDVMGRIVKSESINGCANVSVNGAAGVYMLRLINGDNVKVQKVVVK